VFVVLNTKRIALIVKFFLGSGWSWKNWCFLTKTAICSLGKIVNGIFQYPSFYDFYLFLRVQKNKIIANIWTWKQCKCCWGVMNPAIISSKIRIFTIHSKCRNLPDQHIFWLFSCLATNEPIQFKNCVLCTFQFDKNCLLMDRKPRFWPFLK
jgi:hypothetical protein